MLTIGQQHDVTFKVNVMGTSAEPKARLVLGTHPELSFPATKAGDVWHASLRIPADIDIGSYPLRVEVIVNNRHFTPLTKMVELVQVGKPEDITVASADQPAPEVQAPAEEPAKAADEIEFVAPIQPQDETQPQASPARVSIIQMVTDREKKDVAEKIELPAFVPTPIDITPIDVAAAPKPQLAALQKVVEAPPVIKPRFTPVVTPLPNPADVVPQPVKVKLGDIVKVAEKIEPKSTPITKPKKTKPVVELKTELPVKLIKGDIIYE